MRPYYLLKPVKTLLLLMGLSVFVQAHAVDVGVYGETYDIQETDLLAYIKQRLSALKDSGEMTKMQAHQLGQTKAHADRPVPLKLTKADRDRTWLFDPSVTVPYDLTDQNGRVFVSKGTKVNPLKARPFNEVLVFFDGDDKDQVTWAKAIDAKLAHTVHKLILVKGSVSEQVKNFHQAIYFDQQGKITQHFGLQKVPCLLKQNGLQLQIAEVKV